MRSGVAPDIKAALDAVRARCDVRARREADPVGFAHQYPRAEDQELVALVCACSAFGNVKAIRAKLGDLLERLGPSPSQAAEDLPALRVTLRGWKHRVFRGDDIARLLAGARIVQREHGSLGARFAADLRERGTLREALAAWCDALRSAGGLGRKPGNERGRKPGNEKGHEPGNEKPREPGKETAKETRRGPAHLLPDPLGSSGSKRLLLFLRWMVRGPDGVDLGLWRGYPGLSPALLLVPVDVHIHRLSRNLGFTRRADLSWKTAVEITGALARLDPSDPVGYDFSLCHMGMLQGCPSRRDAEACAGCGVKPVCIHWTRSDKVGRRARWTE